MDEPLKVTKILRVLSLEACQQSLGDKKPISNTEGSELSQGEEDKWTKAHTKLIIQVLKDHVCMHNTYKTSRWILKPGKPD